MILLCLIKLMFSDNDILIELDIFLFLKHNRLQNPLYLDNSK